MEPEKTHKRNRKRSNSLLKQIREQMEFYFGDANLSRDRFLKQQLETSPDGYLSLEMFLKFNKIRAMTSDVSMLAKALNKSEILQVDEEKLRVRRTTKIAKSSADIDDRTIYVECLPHGVDHEWVREAFSRCGKVLYVSLPKYKTTGDIKGFAFVEFDAPESAAKACQLMNNPPGTASEQVGMFPKGSKAEKQLKKQVEKLENVRGDRKRRASESDANENKNMKSSNKRRRTEILSAATEDVAKKVPSDNIANQDDINKSNVKTDSFPAETQESKGDDEGEKLSKKNKKRKLKQQVSTDDGTMKEAEENFPSNGTVATDSQLSLKKKKSSSNDITTERSCTEEGKENSCDTNHNKKDSENLSTSEAKKTKKMKRSCSPANNTDDKNKKKNAKDESKEIVEKSGESSDTDTGSDKKKKKKKNKKDNEKNSSKDEPILELRVISKKDWLQLKSEYLAQQKENMTKLKEKLNQLTGPSNKPGHNKKVTETSKESNAKESKTTAIECKPGTIVKICTVEPTTRKDIKERLGSLGSIAYIDVIDGTTSAHVRCLDEQSAQNISNASIQGFQMTLLAGKDEEAYWKKLEQDRANKLNKKSNSKRRGKDRVLAKADQCQEKKTTKHIVFE